MNAHRVCFLVLLIFQSVVFYGNTNSVKEVSHEDIRDAILSLVHMFRDNTDKLERHESRERQLGEQLKKAFGVIEKKQKNEESNTNSMLDIITNINSRLQAIENTLQTVNKNPNESKLNSLEELIKDKFANLEQKVQNNRIILDEIKANVDEKFNSLSTNVQILQTSVALLEEKFNSGAVSESSQKQDPQGSESKVLEEILKLHEKILEQTTTLSNKIIESTQHTVTLQDLSEVENSTIDNVKSLKTELMELTEIQSTDFKNVIGELYRTFVQEQNNRLNTTAAIDNLKTYYQKTYDQILKEMKGLSKIEQVLIQTADNVLDTKRRIEYGTHQILLEVGDVIRQQTKDLNQSIGYRFDGISFDILNGQSGALTNLSLKIETEISQVWRQIGIMYQTLTNSADTLDKLQQHTEIYVNGSLSTLDNMEGKVGQITGRMTEVDDNLNYLLGRLSLVTQEFNQIKIGLGDALENIRSNFHTVQSKVKNIGPGPNPIEEDGTSYNQLQKTAYSTS